MFACGFARFTSLKCTEKALELQSVVWLSAHVLQRGEVEIRHK